MKKQKKELTTKEVACMHGVTIRRVQRWAAKGLKHRTNKNPRGGRAGYVFDPDDVAEWLVEHDILTEYDENSAIEAPAQDYIETQLALYEPGLAGCVRRLEEQEELAHNMLKRLRKTHASLAEIDAAKRIYTSACEALRKGTIANMRYQLKREKLINYDAAKAVYSRRVTIARNELLGVGRAVIPRLGRYIRKSSCLKSAKKILDDAIQSAFRHFEEPSMNDLQDPSNSHFTSQEGLSSTL